MIFIVPRDLASLKMTCSFLEISERMPYKKVLLRSAIYKTPLITFLVVRNEIIHVGRQKKTNCTDLNRERFHEASICLKSRPDLTGEGSKTFAP